MRVFIAISIVVASVSSASAQFAMDHGHAADAAQAAWTERCRPTVVEDREGLRRVKYAERDCDLSRFNTAGN